MARDATIKARTRAMLAGLVAPALDAHGGDTAVSKTVGVDKSTVGRWRKGQISYEGLEQLASGLRMNIVLTFPAHGQPSGNTKEAPPPWAEELERKLDVLLARAGVDPDTLDDAERTRLVREALARASSSQQTGGGAPQVLP